MEPPRRVPGRDRRAAGRICDVDPDRAADAASEYDIPTFCDFDELLAGLRPDVVSVATPVPYHVAPGDVAERVDAAVERIDAACRDAGVEPVAMNVSSGDVDLVTEVVRVRAVATAAERSASMC